MIELLQRVMEAAEVLSEAMVDEPWQHLTAAIQAVYDSKKSAKRPLGRTAC